MVIESVPLPVAVEYKQAHLDLNADHVILLAVCGDCGAPVGLICLSCREPICAVRGECSDG